MFRTRYFGFLPSAAGGMILTTYIRVGGRGRWWRALSGEVKVGGGVAYWHIGMLAYWHPQLTSEMSSGSPGFSAFSAIFVPIPIVAAVVRGGLGFWGLERWLGSEVEECGTGLGKRVIVRGGKWEGGFPVFHDGTLVKLLLYH